MSHPAHERQALLDPVFFAPFVLFAVKFPRFQLFSIRLWMAQN